MVLLLLDKEFPKFPSGSANVRMCESDIDLFIQLLAKKQTDISGNVKLFLEATGWQVQIIGTQNCSGLSVFVDVLHIEPHSFTSSDANAAHWQGEGCFIPSNNRVNNTVGFWKQINRAGLGS